MAERGLPAQAGKGPEKGKEKSIVKRMSTTVLDIGRDILTANEMAKERFDGDSALLRVARGATTTAIGIGLEKVLDEAFKKNMEDGGKLYFGKLQVDIPPEVAKLIKGFEIKNPRWHHLILQSTKDLLTGTIYNGLAFFSRPMLESAGSEHLVGSLAVNASEAMFTKGLSSRLQAEKAKSKKRGHLEEDRKWDDALTSIGYSRSQEAKLKYEEATREKRVALTAANATNIPHDDSVAWQSFLRQFTTFSNPATLLGLDMLGSSMMTFTKNLREVRKIRKEKGIEGKSVDMSKKYEKKEWGRDKVYYGKSNWKSRDQKAQEEYELKTTS